MVNQFRSISMTLLTILLYSPTYPVSAEGTAEPPKTILNHEVCNDLIGATSGLFGLCVAYCETYQPDPHAPDGTLANHSPNPKLLEIYNKIRTDTDLTMPCISTPPPPDSSDCDIWTDGDLAKIGVVSDNVDTSEVLYPKLSICEDIESDSGEVGSTIKTYHTSDQLSLSICPPDMYCGTLLYSNSIRISIIRNGEEFVGAQGSLSEYFHNSVIESEENLETITISPDLTERQAEACRVKILELIMPNPDNADCSLIFL